MSPSASPALQQQRRGFWLRTLHQWHWISSAVCLIGMLLFAITGITLNHASKIEATPAFFWMVTDGNDRRTQVNAGRAYVRAQLAATAQGLSMHPLQQALQEYTEQAGPYAAIHRLVGAQTPGQTVQMWARLGYAPPVGAAPRRGLEAHLLAA